MATAHCGRFVTDRSHARRERRPHPASMVSPGSSLGGRRMSTLFVAGLGIVGLVLLTVGADQLVVGAGRLATVLRVAPVIVGVVVIGLGTARRSSWCPAPRRCGATRGWRWATSSGRTSSTSR